MKKFTFLFVFVVIAFAVSAKNNNVVQEKIEQNHEKYLKFSEMLKQVEMLSSSKSMHLKSATAKLKLDSIVSWSLNLGNDTWNYDYKDEYFYNSALQNNSWLNKEWNLVSKSWNIESKVELEFDNKGLVTTMQMYDREEDTGELLLSGKFMIFYNSEELQDSALMYFADNEGDPLVLTMKQIRHYNAAKQLEKTDVWTTDDEGEGTDMILSQTIVNTYYGSGKIKMITTNFFLEGEEVPFTINEYTYDNSGYLSSKISSTLSFLSLSMEYTDSYTYKYNGSGKVKEEIYSVWEGAWVNKEKTDAEFNSAGDVSVETYSEWVAGAWKMLEREEFTYGSVNFSDIVLPYFFGAFDLVFMMDIDDNDEINFNKQPTGITSYEMLNGDWKNTGKTTIYYSSGSSTNIIETDNANFAVYPNPATESVSFSWKGNYEILTLELYQVTGARVLEQITSSGKSVSISNLGNGVYLYKLMDGPKLIKTGKLIKN
jgi:hypothetical protein